MPLAAAPTARALPFLLGLYQGMRRAEIAGCRWDAWDFEGGVVKILGKGAKTRTVFIHSVVREALFGDGHPPASGYLFPGLRAGTHVSPTTVWTWVQRVCEEAGLPVVSPHVLRHVCLATMNDTTGDLRTTQTFAGHSRPETTSQYTRTSRRRMQAAVEALDY